MKGEFTIDGKNSYADYRVVVEQYGYKGLIAVPSLKNIETTEWPDEDGIEADLSEPVLSPRTVTLQFAFADVDKIADFYGILTDGCYHEFSFTEIDWTVSLRLQSTSSLSSFIKAGTLYLTFIEDKPVIVAAEPYSIGSTRVGQRGYLLDEIDLSRFGCWVLDGSLQNIRKAPAVKENVTVAKTNVAGQTYLPQYHTSGSTEVTDAYFKSKDTTLKLLINARDMTEFWRCWNALFTVLTTSGAHQFTVGEISKTYECYYKSCSISKFDLCRSGTVWCEFSLALTFLSARP